MSYPFLKALAFPLVRAWAIERVVGLENIPKRLPCIIAVNHLSHVDAPVLASVIIPYTNRSLRFLAKGNLRAWKLMGADLARRWWKVILIPEEATWKTEVLIEAEESIMRGDNVGVFPEGRTNVSNTLLPVKTGVARIALRTGMPVVPVGMRARLPTASCMDLTRMVFARPHVFSISIGRSLSFPRVQESVISHSVLHETTSKIMNAIAALSEKKLPAMVVD